MRLFNRLSDDSRSSDVNQENKVFRGRKNSEGKRRGDVADSLSPRKLGMENLEERQLLSVNPIGSSEYQEIRNAYADLELPRTLAEINVIEVTDLSGAALQAAVDQAAQTPQSDLVLLRTSADDYVLDLESTAIKVNIDSENYGDLTILSRGENALVVETTDSNAFTVLNGNVALDGMVLYNYSSIQYAGDLAVATSDANLTLGTSFAMVNQITTTDAETGETTVSYSLDAPMTEETAAQYGVSAKSTNVSQYRTRTTVEGDYNLVREQIDATLRKQDHYFGYWPAARYAPGLNDGGIIYDAECDGHSGWVGAVANMLAYTGWAQQAGFSTTMTRADGTTVKYDSVEDAVADYLKQGYMNTSEGTSNPGNWNLTAAQILDYFFSGNDQDAMGRDLSQLTNAVEGGGFFMDVDFSKVGGYVASSDSMIDDALAAIRAGKAVTMEVVVTNNYTGDQTREYVSVWGYYYQPNSEEKAAYSNTTNNAANYVGLICTNPKFGTETEQVVDNNYSDPNYTDPVTKEMTNYVDVRSQNGDNYNTYHTYLLQRDGSSWRFATAPYTYVTYADDGTPTVHGASDFPEGFQYYGGDTYAGFYRDGAARTWTAEIVGFSWIQQYTDAIPEVSTTQDEILSLESMPGNTENVIYLHFAGVDGTGWDGLAHPELNLDGSAGYGIEELQLIEEVWRRVAEDYAPFNINVTTDPNVWANAKGGIRVVIGGESPDAGGLSYVGVFGTQKQDNYVYSWSLGLSAKSIAEAASHEVGHALGLGHDGFEHNEYYSGNSTWGPIMGVGYYSEITQWSKGDYVNATNREDDMAIIASKVGYRTDDFGDTIDYAESLEQHYVAVDINNYDTNQSQYMGTYRLEGVIETNSDYDMFSFVSNGGTYVVDVSGEGADYRFIDSDFSWTTRRYDEEENAAFAGLYYAKSLNYTNLNLKVELLDENGEVVLVGLDGKVMKLGYGEYYVAEDDYHFVVYDQFHKKVYNADGSLKEGYLAVDDSIYTTFSHFVTPELEVGKKYYISVTGVGQGNDATNGYSDYGSVGQYTLSMHEAYENFRLDAEKMDVQDLSYANAVDNVLTWQEAFVYSGRRLEDGTSYLGNVLQFNANLSGQTLELRETLTFDFSRTVPGQPLTAKRFVLDATAAWDDVNDRPGITIDANEKFRTIYVDNTTVELYGFTITGGVAETTNVIYLYFGGIDGTGWSGEAHPAFDLDGDASFFNAEELAAINEIYLRVKEDYAPYNVTVTTDQTVFDAATNAIRVVVGGTGNGRGGVAYLNSFGTQKQDCYVFPNSLGLDAKNIAEAISHEVGHTLGLGHDGKDAAEYYGGTNHWAPIMGTGYGPMLSQWSKGEYAGATNTQDDLATIAGYLGYKDDDGGNEQDDAQALRESYLHAGNMVADGILERTGDVDWFKFLATKETFVVDVVGVGADYANADAEGYAANMNYYTNLNLAVELYDAAGNLLYKCNPESSLFAHFEATGLTVGDEYFVRVYAEGQGDPTGDNGGYSNYGCVGQYYVTVAAGTLADFVGESRYQTNSERVAVENGAINATKEKESGRGVNGQTNNGGGVYNNYGWLTIGNSVIAGNRAHKAGGGVYNAGGEYEDTHQHDGWLYIVNSSIVGNIVTDENSIGGGLYNESGAVATLVNVTIAGNTADYSGGGIQNAGYMELYNSIVAKNDADYGADVYNQVGKTGKAYDTLIGDESRNTNYAAWKNGADTQNGGGSLIGTSRGSNIAAQVVVYDPKFVAYREYAAEDWSSELWSSWNLRLQGDSPAFDMGTTDNLNANADYGDGSVRASVYRRLGIDRYYVSFDADLSGRERVSGSSVDAGAYEVLEKADLTEFTPTSAGSDVVNDWENSIVISRAQDDQTGSIAPFLVDEDLFLNLAFVNQGVKIGTNFETTIYLWRYEPGATKDEMFAASKLDGSQVALMNVKVVFEEGRAMPDGQGGVAAKIIAENLATGETQTFEYDGSTSGLALDNVKLGSIEEIVSALVEKGQMNVQNEEGYYVFGYQLDSTNAIAEHREDNNVFLTSSYFNVVESPVSLNDSIVVTTEKDVVDPYDGQISLREAVEVYAGSFYYKEVALPEGTVFESNGVQYTVRNGKFYVDSSAEYNVYPGEIFTFTETVETPLTWNAEENAYQNADGETVALGNGAKATIVVDGAIFDALWNETNGVWEYVDANQAAATARPETLASATLVETPVVSVAYQENVYFDADNKATTVAEGTKATLGGVEVVMRGGVWTRVENAVYTLDDVQEMGAFTLANGTEVAVVNGVFRRLGTNDVAVVLDGSVVTLANGESAVYDSAQGRFVVTKTTEYVLKNGDKIQIGDSELTFATKAYVDDGGYRYYLVDQVRVTLENGYDVVYDAKRDAFLFQSEEIAGKLESGATIVWTENGVEKTCSYKAGVAVVEKVSRETNAVVFDKSLDGKTFMLLDGELTLETKFTLDCVDADGNLLDLTIQSNTSRLFNVTASGDVTIKNFELSSSGSDELDKGGVVYNEGTLTVENVSFSDNKAISGGAIYNAGTLTVVDSTFSGNQAEQGGSIYNAANATLTIQGATFANDGALYGGSIYNLGTADVENAEFVGGVAEISGGAIHSAGGSTTVLNSTFKTSSAVFGGAIFNATDSTLFVDASTFDGVEAGQGGAIFNAGNATVEESDFNGAIASNAFAEPNGLIAAGGAIYNSGTSKITASNFVGSKADGVGGAVYGATNSGELNIVGAAFVSNSAANGGAIYAESGLVGGDLTFEKNVATAGDGGAIYVFGGMTLDGDLTATDNKATNGGAIYVDGNATITNGDLTLTNNESTENGGAVYVSKNLTVENGSTTATGNKAANGGAIYAETLLLGGSATFENNQATTGDGGAIYAANVSLNNALLAKNVAGGKGGAIYADAITLVNVTVAENEAFDAGGLYVGQSATIDNSIIAKNVAGADALGFDLYVAADATATLRSSLLFNVLRFGESAYEASRSLLGVDPKFVEGGYALQATSPAINAGSNDLDGGKATDLAGAPRRFGLTIGGEVRFVDMGAYEYQGEIAPDLEIKNDGVNYWYAAKQDEGQTNVVDQSYFVAGQDVCFDFVVENVGNGIVLDNFNYAVALVAKNQNGETVYPAGDQTGTIVFSYKTADWLDSSDWLAPGAAVKMVANLGALPAGSYDIVLTLDYDGVGSVYEWGEQDGYEGENNNVVLGSFDVFEAPSVVVTTENDVVDKTDCVTSLREAVEYAGNYYNVVSWTVADGEEFVLESGEILTVRNGMLTRKIDVVVKNGEIVDLKDGDRFYLNGKPVSYRAQVNGGCFVDANGNEVDLSTGELTYPDGTVAEVKLSADQYVSSVGGSDLNQDEGDRYAYRTFQAPGQDPVKLVDGQTYDYANVSFAYYDRYEKDGVVYADGAFVFEDGSVVAYEEGGTLEIANLTLGTLATRDEIVVGALTLQDGSTLEIVDGKATLKTFVGSTVTFADSTQGKTLQLDAARGAIEIAKTLRVDGQDRAITVDGGGATGIFKTTADANVEIVGLTLANGSAARGAAIENAGTLTVENVAFVGNKVALTDVPTAGDLTDGLGGAIYNAGTLTVKGGSFTNNVASEFGGAIFSIGETTVDGATFTGNQAFAGGAIAAQSGTLTVFDSTFENANKAERGAAVYAAVDATFENVVFKGNTATADDAEDAARSAGGAIYATETSTLTFAGSATFENNAATGDGGAIYAANSVVFVGAATFVGNSAANGGAIYAGNVSLKNALVAKNVASGQGGAIYADTISLVNVTVAGNSALNAGGLYVGKTATLVNAIVAGNAATFVQTDDADPIAIGVDLYVAASATVAPLNSLVQNVAQTGAVAVLDWNLQNAYRCVFGVDPQFVDAANGDYSLQGTSPAINAGSNDLIASENWEFDLAGNARYVGLTVDGEIRSVDMGAYEYQTVVAPNLAFGENPISFWYASLAQGENPTAADYVKQNYFIEGTDAIVDFSFANVGDGKVIDKFSATLTVRGTAADGTTVEFEYKYQYAAGADYCDWLSESSWLDPNETFGYERINLNELYELKPGSYELTLTLDADGDLYERDEDDAFEGESDNVYSTTFEVRERPSVVVTTDQDVVDPLDGKISLREAVEVYAGPIWYAQQTLVADGEKVLLNDLTQVEVRDGVATADVKYASVDGGETAKLVDGTQFAYGYEYVRCESVGDRVYNFVYPNGEETLFTSAPNAELTLTLADGKTATVKTMTAYDYLWATGIEISSSVYVDVVVVDGVITRLDALESGVVYGETQVVFRENAFVGQDGKTFAPELGAQVVVGEFAGTLVYGGVVGADGTFVAFEVGQEYEIDGVSGTFQGAGFVLPNGAFQAFGADEGKLVCENGRTIETSLVVETLSGELVAVDGRRLDVADGVAEIATFVGSTITFADSLDGRKSVLGEEIEFSKSLNVDASNIALTISGNSTTNVFVVDAAATVVIGGLTIENAVGAIGSALYNEGTTTLIGVDFVGNKAIGNVDDLVEGAVLTEGVGGAIYNAGTLTIEDANFRGNQATYYGGAIVSVGTLQIVDAIFATNVAGYYGGAIYLQDGTATIDDSNMLMNQATYGGAIAVAASDANVASLKIANTILAKNEANHANPLVGAANVVALRGRTVSGGAIFASGTGASVSLTNVTVAANKAVKKTIGAETFAAFGGAIALDGANLELVNTIVAQNVADAGTDLSLVGGAVANVKASLIGVGDDCGAALTISGEADSFVGTKDAPIDPDFANERYELSATSPAINAGRNDWAVATDGTALEEDYFGNDRVVGVVLEDGTIYAVDLGAVETQEFTVAAPDLTFGQNPTSPWFATANGVQTDFAAGWDVCFDYEFVNAGAATVVDSFSYSITIAKLDANGEVVAGSEQTFRRDYGDGSGAYLNQRDWLAPNATVSGTWNLGALEAGNYRLTFALDVDGKVVELSEDNNVFETTFGVAERPSLVVTTEADVVDRYDGLVSLREALAAVGQDAISETFAPAEGETFALADGGTLVYANGKLTLKRDGETPTEEDAQANVEYELANGAKFVWNGDATAELTETLPQAITFAESVYGKTIVVGSELTIDRSTAIEGTGSNVVVSGGEASRILRVSGGDVSIFGLTFENGSAAIGAAIYNAANLTLTDVAFNGNKAEVSGGAIYNDANGTLTATNATFVGNVANEGGAIYNVGTATFERHAETALAEGAYDFAENTAENGGAIYNKDGELTLLNVAFNANFASASGGAIYNEAGNVEIGAGASFVENNATHGGALVNNRGYANVANATFVGNVALKSAGAIDNYGAIDLTAVSFEANKAVVSGGAIYNAASGGDEGVYSVVLVDVEFANNEGGKFGGAIYNAEGSDVDFDGFVSFDGNQAETAGALYNLGEIDAQAGSSFANNAATNGAAGAIYNAGIATFVGATFDANAATTDGGAVFNAAGAEFNATSADVSANSAKRGGAFFNEGTLSVSNSVVWKNVANEGGAISNVQNGQIVLRSSTVAANSATTAGGVSNLISGKGVGSFEAFNAIVANNFAETSADFASTGFARFAHSLLGTNEGVGFAPTFSTSLSGDAGFRVAPIFDENGALTNADSVDLRLVATSQAINVGNEIYATDATEANQLTTDLDGAIRVCSAFDAIDMGAYEYQFETPTTNVSTENDVVDPTDGKISLREALEYAKRYGLTDAITFGADVARIMLNSTLIVDFDVTIEALGDSVVLDATNVEGPARVVEIAENAKVELINLTLTGGRMDGDGDATEYCGGGLYNKGDLTLQNVSIVGNVAVNGGGLYNVGKLTAKGLLLENNASTSYGGGYSRGELYVENSTIRGNSAQYQGGGFGVYTSQATFVGVAIYGNEAEIGAGLFVDVNTNSQDARLETTKTSLTNCTVVGNVASRVGGGVWMKNGLKSVNEIVNSIVVGNVAESAADLYSNAAADVSYSMIETANVALNGAGMLRSGDAKFTNIERPTSAGLGEGVWKTWDLTLQVGSAAVNQGSNAALPEGFTVDLAGNPRVVDGVVDGIDESKVDLGAFEKQGNVAPSSITFLDVVDVLDPTAKIGTKIATVQAFDADVADPTQKDELRYEIVGDEASSRYFAIGGENNDEIVLARSIQAGVYTIVVRATDASGEYVEESLEVLVVNLENPSFLPPTITTVVGRSGEITVCWDARGQEIKEYVVQYSVDGGGWKQTNALTGDHVAIQDADVQIDSVVVVRVQARADVERNASAWSSETTCKVEAAPEAFNVQSNWIATDEGQAAIFKIDSLANVHSSWRIVWGDGSEDFVSNELSTQIAAAHVYQQAGTFSPTLYVDGDENGYVLDERVVTFETVAAFAVGETLTAQTTNVFSAVEAVAVAAAPIVANDVAVESAEIALDFVLNANDETVVEVAAAAVADPIVLVAKPTTRAEQAAVVAEARRDAFAAFDASNVETDAEFDVDFVELDGAFDEAFLNDLFEN